MTAPLSRRTRFLCVFNVALALVFFLPSARGLHHTVASDHAHPFLITLDERQAGRRFDGHGGLSAGASSRLLFDYPEPERSQILDLLFLPNHGAALHICKVEIGGDVQSTDGTEASHQHTRFDDAADRFNRGYEWWLMAEAKRRNPNVITYVLSWVRVPWNLHSVTSTPHTPLSQGVPGWVGNGSYFSHDNVQYQADFIAAARTRHNISVDYIGIWNERPWGNTDYVKQLRKALDAVGAQSTTIVGSDSVRNLPPDLVTALSDDASFSSIVGIAGVHYACNRTAPPSFWSLKVCSTYPYVLIHVFSCN